MRDFDDVAGNLTDIEQSIPIQAYSDSTQRVSDLRGAALVGGSGATASLTPLGQAVLQGWRARGVANADKRAELARTAIVYGAARRLGVAPYTDFFIYWSELRVTLNADELIDNWDALFTLNYLDTRLNGFAPGDTYRDEATPVADIRYDLDIFATEAAAGPQAIAGAAKVGRAISGKIPRGRARATACLAMELILRGPLERPPLIARFGLPKKPRTWDGFTPPEVATVVQAIADYDTLATAIGPTTVAPTPPQTPTPAAGAAPVVPPPFDFAKAMRAPPKPIRSKATGKKGGSKKIDHGRRHERNSEVGRLGEQFALAYEHWSLRDHPELLSRIVHVSLDDDTLGYDIHSFNPDSSDRLIEVKATEGPLATRFYISSGERAAADANPEKYVIFRVGNLRIGPVFCELRPPFDELEFRSTVYEATFRSAEDAPVGES